MSMPVAEIKAWLRTLPRGSEVGIDEEGMCLTVVGEDRRGYDRSYLEIGCTLSSNEIEGKVVPHPRHGFTVTADINQADTDALVKRVKRLDQLYLAADAAFNAWLAHSKNIKLRRAYLAKLRRYETACADTRGLDSSHAATNVKRR